MGILKAVQVAVSPVGGAGVSTANVDSSVFDGQIEAIYMDYTTAPATTDVTITDKLSGAAILTLTNTNTDGWYFPRILATDKIGGAIAGLTIAEKFCVSGGINVLVAQGDVIANEVKATIFYRR